MKIGIDYGQNCIPRYSEYGSVDEIVATEACERQDLAKMLCALIDVLADSGTIDEAALTDILRQRPCGDKLYGNAYITVKKIVRSKDE